MDISPELWQQVKSVFHRAVDLPCDERERFLRQACAGDEALFAEVSSLLESDPQDLTALREPLRSPAVATAPAAGRSIGPYRLLRQLGRGGMSTVYLAVREAEGFRQRVAVKVIRTGLGSGEILQRFHRERQILAGLDHPNIARLLDGGRQQDGSPFFVLEYVEGQPIDEYCDHRRLPLTERLQIFRQVCAAVQHAHRNLVVHRDLKPGNVLVDPGGVPKLLDFGIAKLVNPDLGGPPVTAAADSPGWMTTGYASPEQIRGEPVTTASDIYSLGVLLYELLAGQPPFALAEHPRAERERRICDVDPPPPSTRVGGRIEIARARGSRPRELRRRLAGDLDHIVLKALAQEPQRRYASAEQLAEDLDRHLTHRPVRARPAGLPYRAVKLMRRNRLAAALTAAVALFTAVMTLQAVQLSRTLERARRQEARAVREQIRAETVSGFLVDLFDSAAPARAQGEAPTVRELLDTGVRRLAAELDGEPEVRAELLDTLGVVYQNLGLFDPAEKLLWEALELRRSDLGDEPPEVASSLVHLAFLYHLRGDDEAAERFHRKALDLRRQWFGAEHPAVAESLHSLAEVLHGGGDPRRAEELYREALRQRRALLGPRHPEVAETLAELGLLEIERGDAETAEPKIREALEIWRHSFGDRHPRTATGLGYLALARRSRGDFEGAESLLREALQLQRRLLGANHPDVARTLLDLGNVLYDGGDPAAAEPLLRRALDLFIQIHGEDHPIVGTALNDLALSLQARGDLEAAGSLFERAVRIYRETLEADHPALPTALVNLARLRSAEGDPAAAEELFRNALELRRKILPAEHRELAFTLFELGRLLNQRSSAAAAEPLLAEALAALRGSLPQEDPWIAYGKSELGASLAALGRTAEAEPLLREARTRLEAAGEDWRHRAEQARRRLEELGRGSPQPSQLIR